MAAGMMRASEEELWTRSGAFGRKLERGLRAVALGGGTGLPIVLRALRSAGPAGEAAPMDVTAVVAVTDDGGSSGRLRRRLGIPAPGDVRNCLVAMSRSPRLGRVFQHRFRGRREIGGHTVGNLVLAALWDMHGDFLDAVRSCGEILGVEGRVLPSTLTPATLVAERVDGSVVSGERRLGESRAALRRIWLDPVPRATPGVEAALAHADLAIVGPGSLYSSLLPNLLVPGVARGLRRCRGARVLVMNATTEPGETTGMSAADHVRAVLEVAGPGSLDYVVVNTHPLPPRLRRRYREAGAEPVEYRRDEILALGLIPIETGLIDPSAERTRHDPLKVGMVLGSLVGRSAGHA